MDCHFDERSEEKSLTLYKRRFLAASPLEMTGSEAKRRETFDLT
jgi:hypothetical protein